MSTNNPPPTLAQLSSALQNLSRGITAHHERATDKKPLVALLTTFAKSFIIPIVKHDQLYPSCHTPIHPSTKQDELKQIQNTLQALSRAVTGLQKKASPPSKPPLPTNLNPSPSYASKAATKPSNPSIVVVLSHLPADHNLRWSRPSEIYTTINNALSVTPHHQVHVSAVRWTTKGNLIVTGGHMTMAHQLQLTSPIIAKALTEAYSSTVNPIITPHTRANVKWSKILINGLPTGVTDSRDAYTPDECHAALAAENPSYSSLIIAQKPSWVKPPHDFTPGSSFSLVMAFEDLDGSKARALLGAKHLYAFGTRATLRKWKQRSTPPSPPSPTPSSPENTVDTPHPPLAFSFDPPTNAPAANKPITRRSAARKSKAGSSATNKT